MTLFGRTLHEHRRSLVGWAMGFITLAAIYLALYPTVRGNRLFSKLLGSYPKTFRSLFQVADYTSGPGYLRAEIFSLTFPLLVVVLAVLWGSDLIAGEEERKTMDILLANPVSRRDVLVAKWSGLVAGVCAAVTTMWAAVLVFGPLARLHVGWVPLTSAFFATALLGVLFGTVALATSAALGKRGVARGVTAALAVGAYLLSTLPLLVRWLEPGRPLSPWYHALGVDPIATGFRTWHIGVDVAIVGILLVVAIVTFDRRDLGVA